MDNQTPLVTVVINSYNQAAYLEKTIQSALQQDYTHMEILLVDGGSTDGSLEIIKRYADRFAWWVSEKDSGQADGINKGLKRAKGEIAAWLNSDDYYLPGIVSRAVDQWRSHPDAVMIYGDVIAVDESGKVMNRMQIGDWQLQDLMAFKIINQPAVFMNRSALVNSGYLDLNYHYLLDHHLWLRIASQGRMVHVPEVWAAGRFHSAAKNVAGAARFGEEAYRMVEWMKHTHPFDKYSGGRWNRIMAGAHRINARYLLDAGNPKGSLSAYWQGLLSYPPAVLPELHRMLYALLSLAGLGSIKRLFYSLRRLVRPVKMD
jgi:glycosyltransferase involved in cell wall biosynthesis